MAADWVIDIKLGAGFEGALDVDPACDKAHAVPMPVGDTLAIDADARTDKSHAIAGEIDSLAIALDPYKDWAIGAHFPMLEGLGLSLSPGICYSTGIVGSIDPPKLSLTPSCDRPLEIPLDGDGLSLALAPDCDRGVSVPVPVDLPLSLDVVLGRSVLTLPPSQANSSLVIYGREPEEELDGATLVPGQTHIFTLTAYGTRLKGYRLVFRLFPSPDMALAVIEKDSTPSKGGIQVLAIADTAGEIGAMEVLTARIHLTPEETAIFGKDAKVWFRTLLEAAGMGEEYVVAQGCFTLSATAKTLSSFAVVQTATLEPENPYAAYGILPPAK